MAELVERFWPKAQRDEVYAAQEAGDWDERRSELLCERGVPSSRHDPL